MPPVATIPSSCHLATLIAFFLAGVLVAGEPAFRPGRVIVKMKPGAAVAALRADAESVKTFAGLPGIEVVNLAADADVLAAIADFKASGLVEYAEPDYILSLVDSPNDPSYQDGTLWGLHNTGQSGGVADADIDAPEAWDIRHSSPNVIVAVIDTGIRYTHQDLAANMWVNPDEVAGNGIDDDGNGYVDDVYGINSILNNGDPMDDNGHGTHCAGTIGAAGNNNAGVVGVTRGVRLMACKFLDSGGFGSTSDAVECLNYARLKGAHITSNSWGGGGFSQAMQDAIDAAAASGMLFVAAAGNSSSNNDASPNYPSNYPSDSVIAVASTTRTDSLSSFSSFGATMVDIGAPGSDVYSCVHNSDASYGFKSGTSMATPHVAGACALLRAHFPMDTYQQLKARLLDNVDVTPALTGRCVSNGRLNLRSALFSDTTPPTVAVNKAAFQSDPTRRYSIHFTAVFSEEVTDFDASDLVLLGDAQPQHVSVNGVGATYDIVISGMLAAGDVTVMIPAGVVHDTSGNANEASTSDDDTVAFSFPETRSWTGMSATSNNFSDPTNWLGNVLPVPGDNLSFIDSSRRASPVNDYPAGTEFGFIGISATAPAFSISGNKATVFSTLGTHGMYRLPLEIGANIGIHSNDWVTFESTANLNFGPASDSVFLYTASGAQLVFNSVLSGSGDVIKYDPGTVVLNAPCTYTGNTSIAGGTLQCGAPNVLPTSTNVSVSNTATLDITGGDQQIQELSGPGLTTSSTPRQLRVGGATPLTTFNGMLGGGVTLVKTGTGTLQSAPPAAFDNNIVVQEGTLSLGSSSALGSAVGNTVVLPGGTLQLNSAFNPVTEPLVLSGDGHNAQGALNYSGSVPWSYAGAITLNGDATVRVNNASLQLFGFTSGTGTFSKTGTGELILFSASTFAGVLRVQAGTLTSDGQHANLSVQLAASSAQVRISGRSGPLTMSAGTLQPGGSSVVVHEVEGPLSFSGGTYQPQLAGIGYQFYDQVRVTGTVSLGGTLSPQLSFVPPSGSTFALMLNDGADPVVGAFNGLPEGGILTVNGMRFAISYQGGDGNDVMLTSLANPSGIFEDFDPTTDASLWSSINAATNTNFTPLPPAATNNSGFFDGGATRQAATVPLDVSGGGTIRFSLIYGSGAFPENADPGEEVQLEYSINGGSTYTPIATYNVDTYTSWTTFTLPIPAGAQTAATLFRWRQLLHSGSGFDHWALDNILIGSGTPPTISDITNQSSNEDVPIGPLAFMIGDADTPAGNLTVTAQSSNAAVVPNSGLLLGGGGGSRTLTITPAVNQGGVATITVTVDDGTFRVSDSFVVTIIDDNTPPTISAIPTQAFNEDTSSPPIAFTVGDAQTPAASLTLSGGSNNTLLLPVSGIAFGGSGANRTVTLTPAANRSGTATVTITVADNGAPDATPYTTSTTFSITVRDDNTVPTISTIATQTITEDQTSPPIAFTVSDAQTPAASLTVSVTTSSSLLLPVSGITLVGSGMNRSLTIRPGENRTGTGTVTVTVSDNGAPDTTPYSASTTFPVTVTEESTPPSISAIADISIPEDTASPLIPFSLNDAHTSPENLTVTATSSNTALVPNTGLVFGGSGSARTLGVTPAANANGNAIITVQVTDDGAPDGTPLSTTEQFIVTVVDDNTPPTLSSIPSQTAGLNMTIGPVPFTVSDAHTPAGSLTVTAASSNTALFPAGSIVLGGSSGLRTITLTPDAGHFGTAQITLQAQDNGAPDTSPVLTSSTTFSVTVSSSPALGPAFRILSLGTTGTVIDANSITGDDRGGIAVSGSSVFLTGDNATARYGLDLTGGANAGTPRDGLVCDFLAGKVYVLGSGTTPLPYGGGTLSSLIELDSNTGVPTGTVITLSQSFSVGYDAGIFSGYGRIVIHYNNRAYNIEMPSGTVTDLGAMAAFSHSTTENWAYWGIAEFHSGAVHLVYVANSTTIARARVPSGPTTTLQSFSDLGDMASITFSTLNNRWYFHYESIAQFGSYSEALGYASATWDSPGGSTPVITALPDFTIPEDTVLGPVPFGVNDFETPNGLTVTAVSSNTALLPHANIVLSGTGTTRTITATPLPNQNGQTQITLTVSDGQYSSSDTFVLTVSDDNTPPTLLIAALEQINITRGPRGIPFTMKDKETPATQLSVTATCDNGLLLPPENIQIFGVGSERTLMLTPNGLTGTATLTLTLKDNGAPDTIPATSLATLQVTLHRGAAYISTGLPFGSNANVTAMTRVFGMNSFAQLQYETADPARLFSDDYAFIFMEGGQTTANEMEQFVNGSRGLIEQWVNVGGALFFNAAATEGDGMLAPLNVPFSSSLALTSSAVSANTPHPVFNTPFTPALTATYSGTVAYGSLSGAGLSPLMYDVSLTRQILAEKSAGKGRVIYGALTTDNLHTPQPEGANLRANILAYLASHHRQAEISGYPHPLPPGVLRPFTVRIVDLLGVVDTDFTGIVSFSSNDANAVLPASYAFAAQDHGEKQFTAAFSAPGTYTLTVSGAPHSTLLASQSGIVVTTNTPPALTNLVVSNNAVEGGTITLSGKVSDPDAGQSFALTVFWGDGSFQTFELAPFGTDFTFEQNCLDDIVSSATVRVTDSAGATASAFVNYTIANKAPVPAIVFNGSAALGTTLQLGTTVQDAGVLDQIAFTWRVLLNGEVFADGLGPNFQFTALVEGWYDIELTATDGDGGVGVAKRRIDCFGAPKIVSGPLATPNPAQPNTPVHFACAVTDIHALTYVWNFGDGTSDTSNSPAVTHAFSPAGSYIVTLTVTDSQGYSSVKSIVVVVDASGGGATPPGFEPDSDGDGFNDAMELAAGSSPLEVNSTPMNGDPAPEALPIVDGKLAVKLNFAKAGQDALSFAGTLMVSGGFDPSADPVLVEIGGIAQIVRLDATGSFKSRTLSVSAKAKPSTAEFKSVKFIWKAKGDFAAELEDDGFVDETITSKPLLVHVNIMLDQRMFETGQGVMYSARQGKTGKAK